MVLRLHLPFPTQHPKGVHGLIQPRGHNAIIHHTAPLIHKARALPRDVPRCSAIQHNTAACIQAKHEPQGMTVHPCVQRLPGRRHIVNNRASQPCNRSRIHGHPLHIIAQVPNPDVEVP